jgi:hypothetical protein
MTPAETEKPSVSDQGEHRAQELGDLYFAADNYAVALEYYRRALDAEARKNGSVDRDALFQAFARIGCSGTAATRRAADALHDLHHRLRPTHAGRRPSRGQPSILLSIAHACARAEFLGARLSPPRNDPNFRHRARGDDARMDRARTGLRLARLL